MKRLLIVVAGLFVLGVLGFGALAWKPAIAPVSPPAPGELRTRTCRARRSSGQRRVLRGVPHCPRRAEIRRRLPDGDPVRCDLLITPDTETGIGTWSEAAFARAMHEGWRATARISFPRSLTTTS